MEVGDVIIIISYALVPEEKLAEHKPKVAILNENNEIVEMLSSEPEKTIL